MSEIYKIAVGLTMTSNVSQVMATLTNALTHAHVKAEQLQGSLNRVKLAVGGAFAATAGIATLKVMDSMIQKGNELVRVQRNMAQAGATADQVTHAINEATRLTSIYKNVGTLEIMKQINDARGIFGNQDVATHEIEAVVRSSSFLRAYQGEEKGKSSHVALLAEMNAALKSGEIAGKITPEEMFKHIDELTAMKVAFGQQVNIGSYLTAQRAAGAGARNWEDDFRYGAFAALAQENGPRAGTMLNTLNNKIVGGSGWTTAAARNAMNLGMIDPSKVEYDANGRVKRLEPGGVKGWETFALNPQKWVDQTFKPLLEKVTTDPIKQGQIINSIFPNQNAARAITEMVQQGPKFHKDAALVVEALAKLLNGGMAKYTAGSYDYQLQSFHEQVDNFIRSLGSSLVPTATAYLASLNEKLAGMASWAGNKDNLGTIETIAKGIGVLAVALTAGGGIAIAAALGPVGWFVAGLTAVGAVLVAFRPQIQAFQNWLDTAIVGMARQLGEDAAKNIETARQWVTLAIDQFGKTLLAIPDLLTDLGSKIMTAIKGWFGAGGQGAPSGLSPQTPLAIIPGAYQGGSLAGLIHGASLGAANSNLPGAASGLIIKPGAASGAFAPGLLDAARVGGGGRVTALNDAYHAGTGSMHARGLAVDLTGNPSDVMGNVRRSMAAAGLVEGRDFKLINEYAHPSARATGGHVHFQFNNKEAADAYHRSQGRSAPPTAGPPPKRDQAIQVNASLHVDGQRFAQMTSRHLASGGQFPSSTGGFDGYGSLRHPGTTLTDAA